MTQPSPALEPGADAGERVRALRRAHHAFVTAGQVPAPVRPEVAASWRRSASARVSPDGHAAVELADADLEGYRRGHPLARVMPLFRELMGSFASDGEHLVAVCDAQARLLWVEGHSATRGRADAMNFVPGAGWAEGAVGTNAPGTAVALGQPVQVFAAEHFSLPAQAWTCAAAPVHDPRTGRLLGAVDVTGGDGLAHPHSLGFVQAVARAAEAHLALLAPPQAATAPVHLTLLGRDTALLCVAGRTTRLSPRHSEILALLARNPEGMTGDQLLCALYEDESVTPVTLRAEMARLRRTLGEGLLASRPYRLTRPVETDAAAVELQLETGSLTAALDAYTGPLLPASRAPAVVRLRTALASALRGALAARRDPDLLVRWLRAPWGREDLALWRTQAQLRPTAVVSARLAQLESELGGGPAVEAEPARAATWSQRRRH